MNIGEKDWNDSLTHELRFNNISLLFPSFTSRCSSQHSNHELVTVIKIFVLSLFQPHSVFKAFVVGDAEGISQRSDTGDKHIIR